MDAQTTLLRKIKENNFPAATDVFKRIMNEKREAAEKQDFKNFAANLFKK